MKEALPNNYNIKITKNTLKDITRVQAKGITKWGDAIRIIGINNRKLNGVMIDNNDISNIERYGIFVQMAPKCQVTNNTFELTEKTGIYLISGCDASTIKYNTISSSNYYGIFLNGVKNSFVLNNKVSNTAKYAIYLAKKSNGSSVILNDLLNVGKMNSKEGGIGVSESQKVKILQNTITNAAKNGVFVYNQSMYCSIKQNSIRQAGENGISVNSNSNYAIIKSNSIIGNDDNNSFDRGIFVYQSKKATIGDNDISNCKVNQKLY